MKATLKGLPTMLYTIVKKNILRIKHSRTSMAVILFGPIALMLIVGLAFNTMGLSGIRIATYAEEYPGFADTVLANIEEHGQQFSITKQTSVEACTAGVQNGDFHMCLLFDAANESVQIHVDYSRMNLVWTLLEVMNSQFKQEASMIGQELTRGLLAELDTTLLTLQDNSGTIDSLGENLVSFQGQLDAITQSLDELQIATPQGGFGDVMNTTNDTRVQLESSHDHVSTSLTAYRGRIETAETDIQNAQESVGAERENREAIYESVNRSYDAMDCDLKNPQDLTPLINDPEAFELALDGDPTPECSILLTMKVNLESSIEDLQRMELHLEAMEDEMGEARDEIDLLQAEADTLYAQSSVQLDATEQAFGDAEAMLEQAQNQTTDLLERKSELRKQLQELRGAAGEGAIAIAGMNTSLATVVAGLSEAGKISPEQIASPFDVSVKPVTSKELQKLDFLFPTLFILVIMFVAVMLGVTIVNKEKASRAHFRNFITPTPDSLFIVGNFLTVMVLTLVQVIILLLLGLAFFDVHVLPVLGGLLCIILAAVAVFSLLGILIGSIIANEETSTLAGIIFCVILFLFSSTIVPLEGMAEFSKLFVQINPFFISAELFRKQLIFGANMLQSPEMILVLCIEFVVLAVATYGAWALIRKRF